MPEKEILEEEFDCHQANEIVTITREVLIHRSSSTGEIDMEKPISFDCDHAETCGCVKHQEEIEVMIGQSVFTQNRAILEIQQSALADH